MTEIFNNQSKVKRVALLRQLFVTLGVAINIVGHGCVIGYSAILNPSLRRPDSHIHATVSQESWIASIVGFALLIGNVIITITLDGLGRKKSHLVTIAPMLTGWFVLTLADSVAWLITARLLQGISMGMLGPLGSIIIGEMTDPKNRGVFLTFVSLSLTVGVLVTHALGTYFTWQVTALICSMITFTSLLMIIYSPESPSWMIAQGRVDEGRKIFTWLRGEGQDLDEIEDMICAQQMIRKSSVAGQTLPVRERLKRAFIYFNETYKKPEFYKPILIMFHLYIMVQFAGMNIISAYALDIIQQVVGPDANAKLLMVALDIERLISNILAVFLMKKLKRRTLLFSTGALCVLSYLGKAGYVYAKQINLITPNHYWIPILLIGIYMFSLAVGIASLPYSLSGEIFPLEYRGLGSGISVIALSLNFFIAVKSFAVLNVAAGLPLTYCLYAGIVVYCLAFNWFFLPETKDKTLQEIEDGFRGLRREDINASQPLNGKSEFLGRRCSSTIIM